MPQPSQGAPAQPSQTPVSNEPSLPPRRLRRRVLRWLWLALAASCLVALGMLWLLLASLDAPWLKRRVQSLVLEQTGLEIDYAHASLTGSELGLEGLVLRTPQQLPASPRASTTDLRALAPELVRVERLALRYVWLGLDAPYLRAEDLQVDNMHATLVLDADGRTSLSAIQTTDAAQAGAPEADSATPLSQWAATWLAGGLPVRALSLSNLTLTLLRSAEGKLLERASLRGLTLRAQSEPGQGGSTLRIEAGTQAAPLAFALEREVSGNLTRARGSCALSLRLSPRDAQAEFGLQVHQQDLASDLPQDLSVQVVAKALFDATAKRTTVELRQLSLGQSLASAEANLEVSDAGALRVLHAKGQLDAARILRAIPEWLLPFPVSLEQGELRYEVKDLDLARPLAAASVHVEGELRGLTLELAARPLEASNAKLSLLARPEQSNNENVVLEGTLSLERCSAKLGREELHAEHVELGLAGRVAHAQAITGVAQLGFANLGVRGRTRLDAKDGQFKLRAQNLVLTPSAQSGQLELEGQLAQLEHRAAVNLKASKTQLRLKLPVTSAHGVARKQPWNAEAELSTARLELRQANGRKLVDAPLHAKLGLQAVVLDFERPAQSRGKAQLHAELAALNLSLEADKQEALHYTLTLDAATLREVGPLLPEVPILWEKMAFKLSSRGMLTQLATPEAALEQSSELKLTGAGLAKLTTRALTATLSSSGTLVQQQAQLDVHSQGLAFGNEQLGDVNLRLATQVDRANASLSVWLNSQGEPHAQLELQLQASPPGGAARFELKGEFAQLAQLTRLTAWLPEGHPAAGVDLQALALKFRSQGTFDAAMARHALLGTLSELPRGLSGQASLDVDVTRLRWDHREVALRIPDASLRATFKGDGAHHTAQANLSSAAIDLRVGRFRIDLSQVQQQTTAELWGSATQGRLSVRQSGTIAGLTQNILPAYPTGGIQLELEAERTDEGLFKLTELLAGNSAGGTTISLQGGLDVRQDQRRLSLHTELRQDLSKLSQQQDRFVGKGAMAIKLSVASANLKVFHTQALLHLEEADLHFPSANVHLEQVEGEVPIIWDVTLSQRGFGLLKHSQINPYATLRFADQHPLMHNRGFLSMARLSTQLVSAAPFAANLKVEQNIVSLSQIEMGVRNGTVTGDGVLHWEGARSTLQTNVHASDVESSDGEPFDGNASLVIDVGSRSVSGRADILQIGRRHLTNLLDLQDPLHENASMNQIRKTLRFGYPQRVRIAFKHGFASAGVEFGGLARLLRVDDVRGIPMGPLVEKMLRSFKPAEGP